MYIGVKTKYCGSFPKSDLNRNRSELVELRFTKLNLFNLNHLILIPLLNHFNAHWFSSYDYLFALSSLALL